MLKTSVKQLEMCWKCPRKWALHYLFGVAQLEGEALTVGNALHAQMAALIEGRPPPHKPESKIGKMARALFQKYVAPFQGRHIAEIQKVVQLPEYDLAVELRADYLLRPIFRDWKTTGAPAPNAKLESGKPWALQSLVNEFQPNIYAFLLTRDHWAGQPEVDARWNYVSKKFKDGQEPRVWEVRHVFTAEVAREWFERVCVPTASLIRDLREARASGLLDNARDVPHNPPSCEHRGLFCDAAGHCKMLSSPVMKYGDLHLPVIQKGK